MAKNIDKTNVMRVLDQKKLAYKIYHFETDKALSGVEVAGVLGIEESKIFKTLVTVGKSKEHYVFVIPVAAELNLKRAASVAGEKNIEMIAQKELLPLTGYVHGGCSPIGMKKLFKTFIDKSAEEQKTIVFSGGKIGFQVEMNPKELAVMIGAEFENIAD